MMRIILAGLFAAIGLFAWESVAHMVLPLGYAGVKALTNEPAVLGAIKDNIKEPGFYLFPAPEDRPDMTAAQRQEAMAKAQERWRTGPAGIMVVHPEGADSLSARQLVTQLAGDLVAMLLAAILISKLSATGYGERVALVAVMGLFPTLQSDLPNWNWYGFPTPYMLAQLSVHMIGFLVGGLVLAKVIRPGDARPVSAPAPGATAA